MVTTAMSWRRTNNAMVPYINNDLLDNQGAMIQDVTHDMEEYSALQNQQNDALNEMMTYNNLASIEEDNNNGNDNNYYNSDYNGDYNDNDNYNGDYNGDYVNENGNDNNQAMETLPTLTNGILPDIFEDRIINRTDDEHTVGKRKPVHVIDVSSNRTVKRGRKKKGEDKEVSTRVRKGIVRNVNKKKVTETVITAFNPEDSAEKYRQDREIRKNKPMNKGEAPKMTYTYRLTEFAKGYHYMTETRDDMLYPLEMTLDDFKKQHGVATFFQVLGLYKAGLETTRDFAKFELSQQDTVISQIGSVKIDIAITEDMPYVKVDLGSFSRLIKGINPNKLDYARMSITGLLSPSVLSIDLDAEAFEKGFLRLIDVNAIKNQYVRVLLKSFDITVYQMLTMEMLKGQKAYEELHITQDTFRALKDKVFYKLMFTTRMNGGSLNVNFNTITCPFACYGFTGYSVKSLQNNTINFMFLTSPSPIVFSYQAKGHRASKNQFQKTGTISYIGEKDGKPIVVRRHGNVVSKNRFVKWFSKRSDSEQSLVGENGLNYEYKYINELNYYDDKMMVYAYVIPYIISEDREHPYSYDVFIMIYDKSQELKSAYHCTQFFIYEESIREFIGCKILHNKSDSNYVYDIVPAALEEDGDVLPRIMNMEEITVDNSTVQEIERIRHELEEEITKQKESTDKQKDKRIDK